MSEVFLPPPEELPPLADLMEIADCTGDDIQAAADKWEENLPDENFQNLLKAEVDEA